jgi:Ca-activated chloride channel homolog
MKDENMTDEALLKLKHLSAPAPSPEARKLALNAAMVAFDAAAARPREAAARKRWYNSRWGLSTGLAGFATAAAALVLLPVGTQLYTASTHAPQVQKPVVTTLATTSGTVTQKEAGRLAIAPEDADATAGDTVAQQVNEAPKVRDDAKTLTKSQPVMEKPTLPDEANNMPATEQLEAMPAPVPSLRAANSTAATAPTATGLANMEAPMVAPQASGGLGYAATQPSGDNFQKFDENRVKVTKDEPVSTFSIDVDTASYAYVRSVLESGSLPEPDAVRLEEMINYFPYDYPAPTSLDTPFKATMQVFPTPWNKKTELLEIGIKGYVPPASARKPENLTFLIDTSGSMDEPNKLPLLKRAFSLLVDNLQPTDTVSIVTYAGSAGVVLQPTKASDKAAILGGLDNLEAGGSTAGAEGIELAYQVAAQNKGDGVNRVILATDGDFNVGIDEPDQLKSFIKGKRDEGISLSVLGFGRGNLDDALMQALAQNGNGNASYIDNLQEARKVLVEEAGANFVTIAKDVKLQVEFNPAQISEYRLIGYETRALNREDFNNDAVDAGEIGAGHTVTALYEITPAGSGAELDDPLRYGSSAVAPAGTTDELGFLKIRYKAPDGDVSKLITAPITKDLLVRDLAQVGNDQRFAAAVAAFGQKLKGSNYGAGMSWQGIADLANGAKGADPDGYRAAFVQEVRLAAALSPDRGEMSGETSGMDDTPPPSVEPPSVN